jgi:hypothetical protein
MKYITKILTTCTNNCHSPTVIYNNIYITDHNLYKDLSSECTDHNLYKDLSSEWTDHNLYKDLSSECNDHNLYKDLSSEFWR